MNLSKRVLELNDSPTLAAANKAKALKAEGKDVLSLTLGEPDFVTPVHVQKAGIASIASGKASFYTAVSGLPELKAAIQERTKSDYGITYEPSEIIVGTGAKFLLYAVFQAVLDKGDEVIIPTPYWVSYEEQVKLAEGVSVFVMGDKNNQYKMTVSDLEAVRTDKTKVLMINSPSNPTGAVYTREELTAIGEWAVSHDILIIADDIYGKLVYNGNVFTSIATISDDIRKQTIVINGVSKAYSMTGWRIGYAMGEASIISQMTKIASQVTSNPSAVSQYAAIEALIGDQAPVEAMRVAFEERLNAIYPKLIAIPGMRLDKPNGAFYFYPDISETLSLCGYDKVSDFVNDLLEESLVAVISGEGFGTEHHIRLSYASDLDTLNQAMERMTDFVNKKMTN